MNRDELNSIFANIHLHGDFKEWCIQTLPEDFFSGKTPIERAEWLNQHRTDQRLFEVWRDHAGSASNFLQRVIERDNTALKLLMQHRLGQNFLDRRTSHSSQLSEAAQLALLRERRQAHEVARLRDQNQVLQRELGGLAAHVADKNTFVRVIEKQGEKIENVDIPENYLCLFTGVPMRRPMRDPDGNYLDDFQIKRLAMASGGDTFKCPFTRKDRKLSDYIHDQAFENEISEWVTNYEAKHKLKLKIDQLRKLLNLDENLNPKQSGASSSASQSTNSNADFYSNNIVSLKNDIFMLKQQPDNTAVNSLSILNGALVNCVVELLAESRNEAKAIAKKLLTIISGNDDLSNYEAFRQQASSGARPLP